MSVLVIQNDPIVPVGQLSAFLGGHEVVRAWEDPQRLSDLAAAPLPSALILLGGRANAYDDEAWPWLEAERQLVRRCVRANVRVLGICLGAQRRIDLERGVVGLVKIILGQEHVMRGRLAGNLDALFLGATNKL